MAISVVIPCHNRRVMVQRAVHGVLQNPRGDLEVVVVDDASDDGTVDALGNINDRRLVVVQSAARQRANAARNRGIEAARGGIIAFLDSDDEFLPGRVDRLVEFFAANGGCDLLFDSFVIERGGRMRTLVFPPGEISVPGLEELLVSHAIPITFSCFAVRRACVADNLLREQMAKHNDRDFLFAQMAARSRIFLGNGQDVVKHQTHDAMSQTSVGEVASLDKMVGRYAAFGDARYAPIMSYLIARSFIKSAARFNFRALARSLDEFRHARHLPGTVRRHLLGYVRGKRARQAIAKKFFGSAAGGPPPVAR